VSCEKKATARELSLGARVASERIERKKGPERCSTDWKIVSEETGGKKYTAMPEETAARAPGRTLDRKGGVIGQHPRGIWIRAKKTFFDSGTGRSKTGAHRGTPMRSERGREGGEKGDMYPQRHKVEGGTVGRVAGRIFGKEASEGEEKKRVGKTKMQDVGPVGSAL